MENTENPHQSDVMHKSQLVMDDNAINHLDETRKWTMFISIVGFTLIGIFIIVGILLIVFFSSITARMPGPAFGGSPLSIIPMFFVLLLYFFPAYYLFQFSRYSKAAIRYKSNPDLNLALKYLKYYYRFLGILLIIVISLYAFFFIVMIVFGGILNNL